ncbi:MAG: DUF4412 domain-containing protein [Ignavibacteriae bacterium]|nr:DUF4412 domain-containing protein [Ignavibacteriota bacterium]
MKLLVVCFIAFAFLFTACSKKEEQSKTDNKTGKKTETSAPSDENIKQEKRPLDLSGNALVHLNYDAILNNTVYQKYEVFWKGDMLKEIGNLIEEKAILTKYFNGKYVYQIYESAAKTSAWKTSRNKLLIDGFIGTVIFGFKDKKSEFTKSGTETVEGYECDVYEIQSKEFKCWIYKDVLPVKFTTKWKITYILKNADSDTKETENLFVQPEKEYDDMDKPRLPKTRI